MFRKPSGKTVAGSRAFSKAKNKASEYARSPAKLIKLIESAARKAESRKGPLAEVRTFLMTCLRMVRAYANHEYTAVPWQTFILIVASLMYFVMPADFIPDFLPGLGLIDDAALLGWTLRTVKSSIDEFREWEVRRANKEGGDS